MKITVKELATMWRAAAEGIRNSVGDSSIAAASLARADQLDKCATDLENTRFHHELLQDGESKPARWFKRIL